ncbi:MAG: antitoxin [Eggerthellaceae bacterium]|nr:antitoxin [Eggerthellaceae bacterium]
MKSIDQDGLLLCKMQGEVFRLAGEVLCCSSPVFIRRFMNSEVARRMDSGGFLEGSSSAEEVIDEVEAQYGESDYGTIHYEPEMLYWMGYLYRYWAYTRGTSSAKIYRAICASELSKLYYPYHSLDPDQSIERICEAKGLEVDEDMLSRGVKALRKIRAENRYEYAVVRF